MTDFSDYKGIWVFCEQRNGELMSTDFELVSEAARLAKEIGCKVTGVVLGNGMEAAAKELGGYGADEVIVCDDARNFDAGNDRAGSLHDRCLY